jgi:signal transduction histidine kinase
MISIDANSAEISHEVGQPLTAVTLNATAALEALTRPKPNSEEAVKSLRAVVDCVRRSFEVVRGIREMVSGRSGWTTEFNLNELVRETAALLDRELVAAKVSFRLELDEALPPVRGNRVQMQQVVVNLVTNAIEAVGATRGRSRTIAIRSLPVDDQQVLLEVSDSGVGISAEQALHVFDAFNSTKAGGTGIGLSLCRTIVEEHGGRIWASPGEKSGATFHVQLPRDRAHAAH